MVGAIGRRIEAAGQLALATVIRTRGSTPRKKGARLLIDPLGGSCGTVGGGCGEAEVFSRAQRVLATGSPELLEVNLLEDQGWESDSICGGILDIWIERFTPDASTAFLSAAQTTVAQGLPGVAVALVSGDGADGISERAVCPLLGDGSELMEVDRRASELAFPLGDPARQTELVEALGDAHLPAGNSGALLVGAAGSRFWVESLSPRPELVVVGAGHVGAALAQMASLAGFSVVVLEDRSTFANPERLPGVDRIIVGDPEVHLRGLPPHPARHIVLVTRGHRMDARCLAVAAEMPARYLGMIGSRRRVRRIVAELESAGVPPQALGSLHAPIGLSIGAETPGEIAVAILAEMIDQRPAN